MFRFLFLFFFFPIITFGQLSFPKGNKLDLHIAKEVLYEETALYFNTGKYKITDYSYQLIFDSVSTDWVVSSCMNGECLNDRPISGDFNNVLGRPDTSGFICFHVSTFQKEGKSKIKYFIYRKNNYNDSAVLEYNIRYFLPNSINQVEIFKPYIFLSENNCYINGLFEPSQGYLYQIIDLNGAVVQKGLLTESRINLCHIPTGMYVLQINNFKMVMNFSLPLCR